jgi:hypothetical protein
MRVLRFGVEPVMQCRSVRPAHVIAKYREVAVRSRLIDISLSAQF